MRLLKILGIVLLVAGLMTALVAGVGAQTVHMANYVVISEIHIAGGDDWIELYNPTNQPIDLKAGGYRIERATASGGDPDYYMGIGELGHGSYPGGTVIPAYGFYLIVDAHASAELQGKADAIIHEGRGFALTENNVIYLATGPVGVPANSHNPDPDIVDYVGYGGAPQYEGTGQAPAPPTDGSIERKAIAASTSGSMAVGGAHHTWGNGEDTNNNSADFVTKTTPDPQNSLSATEDCPAQTWYLSGGDLMFKEDMTQPEGTTTIADDSSDLWKANEAAQVDVGFPAGTWTGKIRLEAAFATGHEFTVEVGSHDGTAFSSAGLQTLIGAADKTTFSLSISASAFDVNTGHHLALRITNPATGTVALQVRHGGNNSYITSPETDPGYPVPELSTIILFSMGLLLLGGYVWLKRRRACLQPQS